MDFEIGEDKKMEWDDGRISEKGMDKEFMVDYLHMRMSKPNEDSVLQYYGKEFIRQCYYVFLNRTVTDDEMVPYLNLMENGMEREGIIYSVIQSKEYQLKKTFPIKYESLYHWKYMQYEWDMSSLLQYEGEIFIHNCYRMILERKPDEGGILIFVSSWIMGCLKKQLFICLCHPRKLLRRKILNI